MTMTLKSDLLAEDLLASDILLVDDNPINLKTLTSILTGRGYQVRTAINGDLALNTIRKIIPDLIILDIRMPDMDGYQVCQHMKEDERYRHIPIIFISALAESQDKVRAFQAGGVDYLTKPFETEEVLARVETHLRLSALQKELETQNAQLQEEIGARKRTQDALRIAYDNLEDRVAARTVELARANEALNRSEEQFRNTFEQAAVGIVHASPEGRFLRLNQRFCGIVGYTQEELCTLTFQDITHPDDLYLDVTNTNQVLEDKIKTYSIEKRYLRKDGSVVWVNLTVSLVREESGEPKYLIGVVQDISQRKETEKELAIEKERLDVTLRSKERLANALRSIGDAVISMDMNGRIILFNTVAEGLTGWSQSEAEGKFLTDVFHLIHEDTREHCEDPVASVMETGTAIDLARNTVLVAKDGRGKLIAGNIVPMRDADDKPIGLIMVCRDITEKHRVEEELQKASKLESIGLLAGGIAHDFNNILTAVIGNIALAKMFISSEHEIYESLVEAENASLQAKSLTYQLLTFAKGGSPIKKIVSIAGLIKDWTAFALKGSKINCTFAIPEDLWPVEIDGGQISQVINNLIINADQAMPKGGTIRIEVKNRSIAEDRTVHGLILPEREYIEISIQDQGYGIPKENLNKIFDPYFTTKQTASGLGLTTSYSIIKSHGGFLTAESEQGIGATFFIYLPALSQEMMRIKEAPAKAKTERKLLAGKGRIMVMDDEEMVRKMLYRILTMLGYDVDLVKDGAEAIDFYRKAQKSGQPFDVVIMDLIIPGGMGGEETIKKLIEIDPHVKAIASSGYSSDPIMANFRGYGFKGCLAKPYDPQILSQKLADVIKKNA